MAGWRSHASLGAKTTPTVQKPLGATLTPVQWSVPGATRKSLLPAPVMLKELTVMVVVPPLTRAMVWTVDVVPRAWLKKFLPSGPTPVLPRGTVLFRVSVCGVPAALSANDTVAVRAPVAVPVGVNVPVTVQNVVTVVQSLVWWKSAALVPPRVTDVTFTVPPEAVTVAVIAVLVVPMAWFPKFSGLGAMVTVGGATAAVIVSLPTLPPPTPVCSVNQILPSGPAVMPNGAALGPKTPVGGLGNATNEPAGVICPIALLPGSTKYMFPSGPAVMAVGWAVPVTW